MLSQPASIVCAGVGTRVVRNSNECTPKTSTFLLSEHRKPLLRSDGPPTGDRNKAVLLHGDCWIRHTPSKSGCGREELGREQYWTALKLCTMRRQAVRWWPTDMQAKVGTTFCGEIGWMMLDNEDKEAEVGMAWITMRQSPRKGTRAGGPVLWMM